MASSFSRRGRSTQHVDITARQVVQQGVELRREQLAVARGEMALERGLVRQQAIERPIEPAVIDRARGKVQEVVQRRRGIPALFNRQLAPGRAEPIDRQEGGHPRPRHIGLRVVYARREEVVQLSLPPQRQSEQGGAQLPRAFQSHSLDEHVAVAVLVPERRVVEVGILLAMLAADGG